MTAARPREADAERLATRLHFAAIHLLRRLRRADEELGLTPPQLSVISTLVNRGALPVTELAAAEQVRAPTMTRLVQGLEANRYPPREASETDGRVRLIRHTTKAWLALQQAAENRARELSRALGELSRAERETLATAAALIERLADGR